MHNTEIEKPQVQIEYSQCQNNTNVQRLNVKEKNERIKKVEKENKELMKEKK